MTPSKTFPPFALLSVILYALAIPPINFWPLIWFVPMLWCQLIQRDAPLQYWKIYLCSLLFWLTTTFWVCFPHPLTSLGWLALSGYLACYLPLFIGVSRVIVHRWKLPVFLVAPFVWVSVELLRNHVFGGMSLGALEHAFYRIPILIQTADLGGGYLVAFVIVLVGCAFATMRRAGVTVGICTLFAVFSYGFWQLHTGKEVASREPLRIAVTQGNYPVMLNPPEGWWEKTFQQYIDLSDEVVKEANALRNPLDLIIWPETVFPHPFVAFDEDFVPEKYREDDLSLEQIRQLLDFSLQKSLEPSLELVNRWDTPALFGATTMRFRENQSEETPERLNSAVLVRPVKEGELPDLTPPRYDKVHLVMFGEYVPLAEYLPDDFPLKTLCQTASRGTGPVAIPILHPPTPNPQLYLSVNICFEGLVPHLIRRQVYDLRQAGTEPDLLVNLSNVGWFYFTSEIDLQFAAQVFRAVENRKPYITAANAGFSAWIDANGFIRRQGKRREAVAFVAEIVPDTRKSFYTAYGDLFACTCMILTIFGFFMGRFRLRTPEKSVAAFP